MNVVEWVVTLGRDRNRGEGVPWRLRIRDRPVGSAACLVKEAGSDGRVAGRALPVMVAVVLCREPRALLISLRRRDRRMEEGRRLQWVGVCRGMLSCMPQPSLTVPFRWCSTKV